MSKYQKLNSEYTTAHVVDDDNDDIDGGFEESVMLYFDDKYKNNAHKNNTNSNSPYNGNGNNNNNNTKANALASKQNYNTNNRNSSSSTSRNVSASTNINNNNNNNNVTNTAHDLEEHTMEIPLLRSSSSSSSNNLHEFGTTSHYRQDGSVNGNSSLSSSSSRSTEPCHSCAQPGFGANLKCKSAQEAKSKILFAISLCCVFMIIEFLGGYIAGSLAIMTDAAHLASDCISFIIGLVAIWLGSRPPDARMSFGYKRLEVLGALASILAIWILTASLVMLAIQRIYSNDFNLDADTMMIISGIGILINIAMIFILHGSWFTQSGKQGHGHSHSHSHSHGHGHSHAFGHAHMDAATAIIMPNGSSSGQNGFKPIEPQQQQQHGQQQQQQQRSNGISHASASTNAERNLNLRAAIIHVIGDLVQSIGVFLAAILIKFCPSAKFADPLCTLVFSVIVITTTVQLFKESVGIVLNAVPHDVSLQELTLDLNSIEGVKSLHHLNVWRHTSHYNVFMVHLVIDLMTDSNAVLDKATKLAASSKYNIKHATIQIERLPA